LATRWVDDDGFDDVVAAAVEAPVVPVGIGEGEAVASAPTPPVTGPLSESCKQMVRYDEHVRGLRNKGKTHGYFTRSKGLGSG
jgi:hypothetical protein